MYLNCKTFFSFRYGTFAIEELVKEAANQGATAIALTNINGTPDTWDFVRYCKQCGIKPIAGAEIRNESRLLYILLAANNKGFKWINRFISKHLKEEKSFPTIADAESFFDDVWDGFVIYPLGGKPLHKLFPNELIGVRKCTNFSISPFLHILKNLL
jgi:DNA polymerase III alpha subunit